MDEAWGGLDRLPRSLKERIEKLAESDVGDAYSAACRPGSWEYRTEWAAKIRGVLEAHGFEAVADPAASWRVRWQQRPTTRAPLPGELCTCGRTATIVYLTKDHGDVPYCGIPDGGANKHQTTGEAP